jgi:hypothetical protein
MTIRDRGTKISYSFGLGENVPFLLSILIRNYARVKKIEQSEVIEKIERHLHYHNEIIEIAKELKK